jgi:hypothetical protein
LRGLGNQVRQIKNARLADQLRVAGRTFDLKQSGDVQAFARTMGLSEERSAKVSAAIAGGGANMRDELAQLAVFWAQAERTHVLPGRMVISGEHMIGIFWGRNHNGMLGSAQVKAVADVFPLAAGAIEDLHLSACNTVGDIQDWPRIFPNLKTVWAYLHTAPSISTGALDHLRLWDRATRGPRQRIDRLIAKNTRRGENVAVWSRLYGLQTGVIESVEALRARIAAGAGTFEAFFAGESIVTDHQSGPLRQFYDTIQSLLQHEELPAAERHAFELKAAMTIRLIYFDAIRVAFSTHNRSAIASGYAALDLPAPDFSRLDRKQALAAIDAFVAKAGPKSPEAVTRLRPLLVDGLRNLSGRYIPENWI